MNIIFLALGFIFYAQTNSTEALQAEKIVGGNDVPVGIFTYVVKLLRHFNNQTGVCGGAILSDRHVVTAAHCVILDNNVPLTSLRVSAGIFDRSTGYNVTVDVQELYVPREYYVDNNNYFLNADIAILKLKEDLGVKKNLFISTIDLPAPLWYEDERAIITGFGVNEIVIENLDDGVHLHFLRHNNTELRYVQTQVLKQSQCLKWLPNTSKNHLCARMIQRTEFKYEGTCRGDSGGPLVVMHSTLIGIQSMGPVDCNEKRMPGIYTRVTAYNTFLRKVMNGIKDPHSVVVYHHDPTLGFVLLNPNVNRKGKSMRFKMPEVVKRKPFDRQIGE